MKNYLVILAFIFCFDFTEYAQIPGKISGKLTYPSDYIPPDMVLCLETKNRNICSNSKHIKGYIFKINTRNATYSITLPVGNYYIYGLTNEMGGVKAYYNEFVRCGMDIKCHSKKKILLKVKSRQPVRGITIGDWY